MMPFFKHFAISLLILSTIGSTLTVPLVYLDFEMRRDFIAEVLCINRDKPITTCGGVCYLELNLERSQPNSDAIPSSFTSLMSFYFQEIESTKLSLPVSLMCQNLFLRTTEGTPNKISIAVFQPPPVLV
ncbi:MAG: hypothetical protein R8G66_18455 [Cytophagales bacterium]|nr:hypothetical protein [Cytophagales bacterium]